MQPVRAVCITGSVEGRNGLSLDAQTQGTHAIKCDQRAPSILVQFFWVWPSQLVAVLLLMPIALYCLQ